MEQENCEDTNILTQTESKCYGNKPSPESSSADEHNQYCQVTISQKFLTAYKETGRFHEPQKTSATIKPLFVLSHKRYFFIAKNNKILEENSISTQ